MSDIYTSFGRTLRELAEENDSKKRAELHHRLASQFELAFNAQANNTQAALGNAELGWHDRLDEVLKAVKGMESVSRDTHQLVQGLTSDVQQTGAAIVGLRSEFQATGESIDQWRKDVDATLDDFRQSRQRSIDNQKELRADLEESKADRRAIRQEQAARDVAQQERDAATTMHLNELAAALENLRLQYHELELSINGRLTQLIKVSQSVARAEGRDAERAEHASDDG